MFPTLRSARVHCAWPAALILAALLLWPARMSAKPSVTPLNRHDLAAFDHAWERDLKHQPNLGSRDLYSFLLNAALHGWRPNRLAEVIDLVEQMHDRDPASPTYGNYRWYWHEAHPDDRNAVEFCMQLAALTWETSADKLPAEARDRLRAAMTLGAEGMLRHRVPVSYTNIFLMRLSNCILLGEILNRPDLVSQGRAWFDDWFAYTSRYGIHEYASPTYTGVDLEDLGALERYTHDRTVRDQAHRALRLLWTEIAANWFAPHGALGGARSRDYDFLRGHGELDWMLEQAGWIPATPKSLLHSPLPELTFVPPPDDARAIAAAVPRTVVETWGEHPWERSTLFVGHHVTLGTAGASYGAQDKVFCIALQGGPRRPLITFALDYRDDPYGRAKIMTSGSHPKLTHLEPFVASDQSGTEALLLASVDPRHTPNPAGRNQPMSYAGLTANVVFPADVQLWTAHGRIDPGSTAIRSLEERHALYLKDGDVAVALAYLASEDDHGKPAQPVLALDGSDLGAARYALQLASGAPARRVTVVLWARVAEGLDATAFAAFRTDCEQRLAQVRTKASGGLLDITVPATPRPLELAVDLPKERRMSIGHDDKPSTGFLIVNRRDVTASILSSTRY